MWPFSSSTTSSSAETHPAQFEQTHPSSQFHPQSRNTAVEDGGPAPLSDPNVPPQTETNPKTNFSYTGWPEERLSIPILIRGPILMTTSFLCGFSLGATNGGAKAAYRYRAENAHRLPTTQTGWYLYQKSKNYHTMLGGIKEGVKFGGVCTGWATLFMVTEEVVDQARGRLLASEDQEFATGQRDAAGTVIAAMNMAGLYSWKRGLDRYAAARTAKIALKYSLLYGLVQDGVAVLRGETPAYIRWISNRILGRSTIRDNT